MDANRTLPGLNINLPVNATIAVTDAATTTTVTAAVTSGVVTAIRKGVRATLSAGAKAFAKYTGAGAADSTVAKLVATSTTGQAAIVVHALKNVSGTETLVQVIGTVVDLDLNGTITSNGGVLPWPVISDDTMVPLAYTVVVNPAASSTATFTFGTTNWNATSIVKTNSGDLASLPRRPLTTTTATP